MNKRLRLAVRNAVCDNCTLGQRDLDSQDRCITGFGPNSATWMVVTNYPIHPDSHVHKLMVEQFAEAGVDATQAMWCSAVKCRVWDVTPNRTELKICREYLIKEIDFVKPDYIITFGNEALFATTGKTGIGKHRGRVTDYNGTKMFHTISSMSAAQRPRELPGLMADLRYFYKLMNDATDHEKYHKPTSDRVLVVDNVRKLQTMAKELQRASLHSFDIESTALDEFQDDAAIVSLAVTSTQSDMSNAFVWQVPLYHPESPFKNNWRKVVKFLGPALKATPKRVAHNGKHDCRFLRRFDVPDISHTFDTIMALAVLDENQVKGLKPAAQQILGAEPWGIDVTNLLETPLEEVLEYNGLDTWHDLRLYFHLKQQLRNNARQGNLFAKLLMPVMREFINMEAHGIYVDRERLYKNGREIRRRLSVAQNKLDEEFLPTLANEFPDKFIGKDGQPKINWNPSDFARWFLYDHLGLPILKRGKKKSDGSPGDPSMDRNTLLVLQDQHEAIPIMLDRSKWNQLNNTFIGPYQELLTEDNRLRTVFKPWGPVTGRVASGKQDEEKFTGALSGRSINLQQVPQELLVKTVFGAPPEWLFVNADESQIELRVVAFLAQEPTMLHLFQTGQDLHTAAAMQMTGKPKSEVTKDERQRAKARNFGFLYAMGWERFIYQAFIDYGIAFTEAEAKANRKSFFDQFSTLQAWHHRQRRIATKYGRVQTPMGRVRHLPDIHSPDEQVRAEAERQAINSPVQAMASDISMLCMLQIAKRFRREKIRGHAVGFVHDSVSLEIHQEDIYHAIPIIKYEMENPPLKKLFNIELNVPLRADIQVGYHWGEGVELPENAPDWQTTIDIMLEEGMKGE